ncbi:MAG: GntR family transcriptional regulator [Lachnospiraceae bacterium]|nr:GntR family transcriptional regulator [Lachnospiraceae bacterium]
MTFATKADYVYEELKKDIIEGRYEGGERLVVAVISKKYGVSPIPIREAFQRLAQDGLLEIEPHVGARVAHMDYRHVWELMLLREQIEPLTAKLAVPAITEKDIARLEEYNRQMEECLEAGENARYEKINKQFHSLIYSRCPYRMIRELTMDLWSQSALSRTVLLDGKINRASSEDHREMAECIRNRDGEKIFAIVKRHKERAFRRFMEKYGIEIENSGKADGKSGN